MYSRDCFSGRMMAGVNTIARFWMDIMLSLEYELTFKRN